MQRAGSGERAGSSENVGRRGVRKSTLRAAVSEVPQGRRVWGQEECVIHGMYLSYSSKVAHLQIEGVCSGLLA